MPGVPNPSKNGARLRKQAGWETPAGISCKVLVSIILTLVLLSVGTAVEPQWPPAPPACQDLVSKSHADPSLPLSCAVKSHNLRLAEEAPFEPVESNPVGVGTASFLVHAWP
mmetsp:Transcript_14739/g.22049  ORF Transcript_14739/g.22049 Transcript_14739/m.22049 type:complete len:112 (+) Transcript_14739:199-534(+)